ncbi:hypothetical protein D3C80_1823450 [compost metagenome]
MQGLSCPQHILNNQRAIETVQGTDLLLLVGGGVGRKNGCQGIAGSDMDQQEADDADAKGDGYQMKQTLQTISQHGVLM